MPTTGWFFSTRGFLRAPGAKLANLYKNPICHLKDTSYTIMWSCHSFLCDKNEPSMRDFKDHGVFGGINFFVQIWFFKSKRTKSKFTLWLNINIKKSIFDWKNAIMSRKDPQFNHGNNHFHKRVQKYSVLSAWPKNWIWRIGIKSGQKSKSTKETMICKIPRSWLIFVAQNTMTSSHNCIRCIYQMPCWDFT